MRAGRPRSQAMQSRPCRGGCPAGDFSESRRAPFGKLPYARQPCPCPGPGGSFESETTGPYAYQEPGPCPVKPVFYILNIDTQDRQDKQDEKLLHKKLTGSIIECAFVENLSVLRGPSWTPFESFPTPWNPFADSSFCPLNRYFSALGGNLFSLPILWRIPLELSPTP